MAGLDSWIYHSRIKCWNPLKKSIPLSLEQLTLNLTNPDTAFSCEPTKGLKLLFKKQIPNSPDKWCLDFLGLCCLWNSHSNYFQCGTIFCSPLPLDYPRETPPLLFFIFYIDPILGSKSNCPLRFSSKSLKNRFCLLRINDVDVFSFPLFAPDGWRDPPSGTQSLSLTSLQPLHTQILYSQTSGIALRSLLQSPYLMSSA